MGECLEGTAITQLSLSTFTAQSASNMASVFNMVVLISYHYVSPLVMQSIPIFNCLKENDYIKLIPS